MQIAFARRDRSVSGATDGVAKTISAPAPGADGLPSLPEGHTYHDVWSVRPGLFKAVSGAESATLTVTPLELKGAIRPLAFTVFEREATGEVVGLYSDVVYLEVSEE